MKIIAHFQSGHPAGQPKACVRNGRRLTNRASPARNVAARARRRDASNCQQSMDDWTHRGIFITMNEVPVAGRAFADALPKKCAPPS
jgi:hypothetical protein